MLQPALQFRYIQVLSVFCYCFYPQMLQFVQQWPAPFLRTNTQCKCSVVDPYFVQQHRVVSVNVIDVAETKVVSKADWHCLVVMMSSMCPTFGGSRPGLSMELLHSVDEKATVACGYSGTASSPSAYASVSVSLRLLC